jgi:hypothetical protein
MFFARISFFYEIIIILKNECQVLVSFRSCESSFTISMSGYSLCYRSDGRFGSTISSYVIDLTLFLVERMKRITIFPLTIDFGTLVGKLIHEFQIRISFQSLCRINESLFRKNILNLLFHSFKSFGILDLSLL